MNIADQRTQPLPRIVRCETLTRRNYAWLKRLSDLSGIHLVQLYLLVQGRQVANVDQAQVNQVLLRFALERRRA